MHESALMADLLRRITAVAQEQRARRVVGVRISLGALSHISPDHLREHFAHAAVGSVAAGARLDIETRADMADPHAQEILLQSLEVEE